MIKKLAILSVLLSISLGDLSAVKSMPWDGERVDNETLSKRGYLDSNPAEIREFQQLGQKYQGRFKKRIKKAKKNKSDLNSIALNVSFGNLKITDSSK